MDFYSEDIKIIHVSLGTDNDYFGAKVRLVKYLTNNSALMKEILPVRDMKTPVNVTVKTLLRQITDVDERYQAIRLTLWLRLNWNNPFLTWDPAEYGGIETVHVDHELFWVPDVALFNEATFQESTDVLYKRFKTKLIIDSNGSCWWNVPTTMLSQCTIDVSRFPFDEQECHISIGSWTYSSHEINFTYFEQNADRTNFIESAEWKLKSALLNNILRRYNYYGTQLPYTDVTLTLKIKRRITYYLINIILPSVIIMFLSLLSFCLPSDHGERITLTTSALVAFTVYMVIASSFSPETSDGTPHLAVFNLLVFIVMSLCVVATCLILRFPDMTWNRWIWWRKIALKLPRCNKQLLQNNNKVLKNKTPEEMKLTTSVRPNAEDVLAPEEKGKSTEEEERKQRKAVAKVLDRVFFWVFLVLYVILFVYLVILALV